MTLISWYQVKLFIEHASGVSMDALHILIGFAMLLVAAAVLRRSVADLSPWLAVLMLEIGNEAYDLKVERWPDPGSQLGEAFKDVVLTMVLPTLLLGIARWRPGILGCAATGTRTLADNEVPNGAQVPLALYDSPRSQDEGH